jgi:hypothetical protein
MPIMASESSKAKLRFIVAQSISKSPSRQAIPPRYYFPLNVERRLDARGGRIGSCNQ